ncbi:MAG: hypothetical protein U0736_12045 [Gemmataceae bacterium]
MTDSAAGNARLLAWMGVLDHIEQSLQTILAGLVDPPPGPPLAEEIDPTAALRPFDDRLAAWQTCLDRADADTEQLLQLLAVEEAALTAYRDKFGALRERLADWRERAG